MSAKRVLLEYEQSKAHHNSPEWHYQAAWQEKTVTFLWNTNVCIQCVTNKTNRVDCDLSNSSSRWIVRSRWRPFWRQATTIRRCQISVTGSKLQHTLQTHGWVRERYTTCKTYCSSLHIGPPQVLETKLVEVEVEQSLTPHPTQYRSFRTRSSQPITWLILTNKAVQENKHTETQYKHRPSLTCSNSEK